MFLKCILLSLALSLCTATTYRKGGGIGETITFLCRNGGTDWTISNGGSPYLTNIQERGDVLEINSIVAQHEGNYTCNSETSQLIVLGVVKFQGEHCSPYQHCDLGVTSTLPEGQPIPLNISFDFVNGGPRGERQTIGFIRFKQSGSVLLSCSSGGCSDASNVDKTPDSNVNNIQANVTDNRPINASRVFVVELDISRDSNFFETRRATFTVNVTSTSTVLPSSSAVPPDDTSSTVQVQMTSTVVADPPLTSTAVIPSPSTTTSSSTSESVLTPPPSTNEPEMSSSSSSSSSSLSSSSLSSSSLTNTPVPTAITETPKVNEDHILLASILSAFVVTIIVIVLLLAIPFLVLYSSKRSSTVSSAVDNSQDTLHRLPEVVIEQSSTTTSSTAVYAEIKAVSKEMHSHNVIRNLHCVSTGSSGSSSSSITDGQSYVESPYDVPRVDRELVPDLNSEWKPAV